MPAINKSKNQRIHRKKGGISVESGAWRDLRNTKPPSELQIILNPNIKFKHGFNYKHSKRLKNYHEKKKMYGKYKEKCLSCKWHCKQWDNDTIKLSCFIFEAKEVAK